MSKKLLGVLATASAGRLRIEINDSGVLRWTLENGNDNYGYPKIFYTISSDFKYGQNFIIDIEANNIQFFDSYISFGKYQLNPINLAITFGEKVLTYSGKSSSSFLYIKESDIDNLVQKIGEVTNPGFTSEIYGIGTNYIVHKCAPDFNHCKQCPMKTNVLNCILGHPLSPTQTI